MHLIWQTVPDVSIWYALAARAAGRALVDKQLAEEIDALLHQTSPLVDATRDATDIDRRIDFWHRLCLQTLPPCSGRAGPRSSSLPGWNLPASDSLSPDSGEAGPRDECLASARELFARHLPRLATELPLRVRPFHELWEARGPGLLRQVFRQWRQDEASPTCLVSWVHPVTGGGGWSDAETQTVLFEAVLVNPFAPLPEVLRLAWLIAHAFFTHRRSTVSVAEQGGEFAVSLALVPAVLAAGEHVELTVCNARQIASALHAWLDIPDPRAAELGTTLAAWWEDSVKGRLPWREAVARLVK